jgi:hypothetical protein
MITNTDITVFHKGIDESTRLETWTRFYYPKAWVFNIKGSVVRDGYQFNNRIGIRIPYETNKNLFINNFAIGDIVCKGNIQQVIESQSDVPGAYNITQITDNTFGENPHIHLEGS